jgi:hypothetical protein
METAESHLLKPVELEQRQDVIEVGGEALRGCATCRYTPRTWDVLEGIEEILSILEGRKAGTAGYLGFASRWVSSQHRMYLLAVTVDGGALDA